LKGKVTQCLAEGLPVITTTIGAEGLEVQDGESILIADDAGEIATRVVRAYRDDELWNRISRAGQSIVAAACSPQAIEGQMRLLLGEADVVAEALEVALEPESSHPAQ
jgi:glycosyltransferase involved in cell wall biosynthesis